MLSGMTYLLPMRTRVAEAPGRQINGDQRKKSISVEARCTDFEEFANDGVKIEVDGNRCDVLNRMHRSRKQTNNSRTRGSETSMVFAVH